MSTKLLIIGPPAAGKTVIRNYISDFVTARATVCPCVIGIEECHRELLLPRNRDDSYYYDEQGRLILIKPEKHIEAAMSLFREKCLEASRGSGFVAELSHKRPLSALQFLGREILQSSTVLYVSATLAVRLQRNESRAGSKIPAEVVREYMPRIDKELIGLTRMSGGSFRILRTYGSIVETRRRALRLLFNSDENF